MIRALAILLAGGAWVVGGATPAGAQQLHVVIVVGLAGDPDHGEAFHRWATQLLDTARERYGIPDSNIVLLAEAPERDPERIHGRSTRENVTDALQSVAARATAEDNVLVLLIGHGSTDGRDARFNLPGPDLTAGDFAALIEKISARSVAFVNASSASGAFIEPLAAPGRAVVTATRNAAERYATLFGGPFVAALAGDAAAAADRDKNGRVSILEAFEYARSEVARTYEREGLLQTEHAVLDDNGDGQASDEPQPDGPDGQLAAMFYLDVAGHTAGAVPADPALRALYAERQALEQRVEGLKLLKSGMDPADYNRELERTLVDLARSSRAIRELEGRQ